MASLYMFPSITNRFLKKSSGLNSPTFLKYQKEKRKKRQALKKRRKALKRIFKKIRNRYIMRQAFNNIYYFEKRFDSIEWKLIERRFLDRTGRDPPAAIVYWFLDD